MKRLRSQSGQATLEYILLAIILLGVTLSISRFFKANQIFAAYVEGPWPKVKGMIENGVWQVPERAVLQHPSQAGRRSTPDPTVD